MSPSFMDQIVVPENESWFKRHILIELESIKEAIKDNKNASEVRHKDQTQQLSGLAQEIYSFRPVKKIVYGFVAIALTSVLVSLMALVIKSR